MTSTCAKTMSSSHSMVVDLHLNTMTRPHTWEDEKVLTRLMKY